MYAYGESEACGPAIRLHAARALEPGDAVTIPYGSHSSTHFARYYGFVPRPNPCDAMQVSLSDVLSTLPSDVPVPAGGWAAAGGGSTRAGRCARRRRSGARGAA